jgi:hypothetical protein
MPSPNTDAPDEKPLISNALLGKLVAAIFVLALLTAGISLAGRRMGETIALAGHTDDTELVSIAIGQDRLKLAANTIRFAAQRTNGVAERVDLYLTWPDLAGYSATNRALFDDLARADRLLFVQLSQSTMSRDMSGRLDPIYAHLFAGAPEAAVAGLTLHRLRADTGYGNEVFLTAARPGRADYVVRCALPESGQVSSSGDCQRDIKLGQDLTVLYRFSSTLLPEWNRIDAALQAFVEARLAGNR